MKDTQYAIKAHADTLKNVPDRQPEVSAEMESLSVACEELHNALGQLEERLRMVLQPIPPSNQKDTAEGIRMTELAEMIGSKRKSIEAARMFVNGIVNRLEL